MDPFTIIAGLTAVFGLIAGAMSLAEAISEAFGDDAPSLEDMQAALVDQQQYAEGLAQDWQDCDVDRNRISGELLDTRDELSKAEAALDALARKCAKDKNALHNYYRNNPVVQERVISETVYVCPDTGEGWVERKDENGDPIGEIKYFNRRVRV
jgi:septal ring factor EnvC (AmiA/AmiB activator)